MIRDCKEIVETEGFQPLTKYQINMWVGGTTQQRLATHMMLLSDEKVCYWYTEYMWCNEKQTFDGVCEIKQWGTEIIWAETEEEAKADAAYLRKQEQAEEEKQKAKAMQILTTLAAATSGLDYDTMVELAEDFKKSQDKKIVRLRNRWGTFFERENYLDEDDENMICHIYTEQQITFNDSENHGIPTTVRTEQIQAIYECQIGGKAAIVLTVGGHEYKIYRKDNETIYRAMAVLYGFTY